jgi:hypothetical protein
VPEAGHPADGFGALGGEELLAYLVCWGQVGQAAGNGEGLAQVARVQGDDQAVVYGRAGRRPGTSRSSSLNLAIPLSIKLSLVATAYETSSSRPST